MEVFISSTSIVFLNVLVAQKVGLLDQNQQTCSHLHTIQQGWETVEVLQCMSRKSPIELESCEWYIEQPT